jgi:hypothetical protein
MEVFNSDHGSNILGCGNLCTAGSQIFKTKEFTWFSEVNYFQCVFSAYGSEEILIKIITFNAKLAGNFSQKKKNY